LFVRQAHDTIKGRTLNLREKYAFKSHYKQMQSGRRRRTKDLPWQVELAVGMKVMVTENIKTDLDLTNGARGQIVNMVLSPDEPAIGNAPVVHLKHLPLVKLMHTCATRLEGLNECVIPVEPAVSTYHMKMKVKTTGKMVQRSVRRCQFPITAAYDYRSQGQTLPYVIIDIASPPSGTLTLFNLYVALSQSSGRQSIRLWRDFDDELFLH
jgi:hypothetical protein